MGKRKERRLAALRSAGRRVKLDLFAEPSDGSDVHEEVGGDIDSIQRIKLPKSASSSGQQSQNPLLLLEQYSDDELEEDLNKNPGHDAEDALLLERDDEATAALVEGCKDSDVNAGYDLTAEKFAQEEVERGSIDFSENLESRDEVKNALEFSSKETDLVQTSVPGTSNVQVIGDVSAGWKIVMHEESNNYYYWNIETGETSWEVPDVLAQATQSTADIKTSLTQDPENVTAYKQESALTTGEKSDAFSPESTGECALNAHVVELYKHSPKSNDEIEGYKNGVPVCASQGSEVDQSYAAISTCSSVVNMKKTVSEIYADYTITNEELKPGFDLPSQLVNWSESLLERLKSLQKSGDYDWTSKYILETQIRLSDFKSLLTCKTSLLPFWEHSKRKLKQIEDAVNKEMNQAAVSSELDRSKATDISNSVREDRFQGMSNGDSEVVRVDNNVSTMEHSHMPSDSACLALHQGEKDWLTPIVNAENISSSEPMKHLGNDNGVIEHASQAVIDDETASRNGIHSVEDVDMEVDMELEDANPAGNWTSAGTSDLSAAELFTSLEQPLQPDLPLCSNVSSGNAFLVPEDDSVAPPPPDEEWIPPPPPDNEEIPPPPPDEPVEPLYTLPSSYTQLGQPLCYSEPYQLSYSDSNIKYYGHPVSEVPAANFYGSSETSNVAFAQVPFYYEAAPISQTDSAALIVNAVVPEGYGIVQDATSLPVISCTESTELHVDSSSVRFDAPASIQFGSSDVACVNNIAFAVPETDKGREQTTTASIQAAATGSPKDNDAGSPSKAVSDLSTVASAVSKVQSKASRGKKRTGSVAVAPSLRSNKRVSSLLDKWKAAKEELEDEEEPENAYEILEKKREKEIKEWHAQQIASGEAKDNANFQPLGGDWRERIKRRRAQLSNEVTKPPAEASTDGKQQQPDLVEISKELPSGWQAYWDESTKQVYYGNVVTSETSWTKPKK